MNENAKATRNAMHLEALRERNAVLRIVCVNRGNQN